MKVVIAHRTGQPKVVELPEPTGGRNFVTVRVSHSAMILPQELFQIERAPRLCNEGDDGIPLGSCASGTVMESGRDVRSIKQGVRVAVTGAPYVYHGSQLVVPEHLCVELPKKVNHEEGSFAGVGAAALHMMRTGRVQIGEVVLVFGADLLGLIAVQLVRAAGATPILIDDSDFRLNKAKALGVPFQYQPEDPELVDIVTRETGGAGADCALMTRAQEALSYPMATQLLAKGGVIVLGPAVGHDVSVDLIRSKQIEMRPAAEGGWGLGDPDYELRGAGYPRVLARWTVRDNMDCFNRLLADRKVQISPLITDRLPVERAATAYEKAGRGRDSVLGVVLTY